MKNQTITFTQPYVAEICESELRELKDSEVLVKLAVSTISSGTEKANYTGSTNVSILGNSNPPFPRVNGYSSAGVIEKVGENVTELKVGDRVAVSWGLHSKYLIKDVNEVYKIEDDNITFSEAALWHIGTFPMAAIRKCRLEIGESALVMGLGVLGLTGIKILRAAGATPIVAVDPVPERRQFALEMGADYAFDPYEENFADKVKQVTNGGANIALEITGVGAGLNGALDCMAKFGRIALLGCTRDKEFTVDYYRKVHGPGITLIGAHTYARPKKESAQGWWTTRDDALALQKLCQYGRLEFANLVKEMHSPHDAQKVYDRLATEKDFPLVQFDWEKL